MSYIDTIFRGYGEKLFGKTAMDQITDAQVEEARVYACQELHNLTKMHGKQSDGTAAELFCNYIFGTFM